MQSRAGEDDGPEDKVLILDSKQEHDIARKRHHLWVSRGARRTVVHSIRDGPYERLYDATFGLLSDELIEKIFQYLECIPSLLRVSQVCLRWNKLSAASFLWSRISFESQEHVTDAAFRCVFRVRSRFECLDSLYLSRCHALTTQTISFIATQLSKTLRVLDLSYFSFLSGQELEILKMCEELHDVSLAYCNLSSTPFIHFLECQPFLRHLSALL